MYRNIFIVVTVFLVLLGCNNSMDSETTKMYRMKGNEVTNSAQSTLLANVSSAMQKGGPQYAVEFCNLEASGIVDSLNQLHNCEIARVTEKNRNPENGLTTKSDINVWNVFQNNAQTDTVLLVNNNVVYYKRINTAMPACLKCHGDPESDIDTATRAKLQQLYPEDLATGYRLNDFRGLWKVQFER
jgi:fibrillarin-like rRNA methylase